MRRPFIALAAGLVAICAMQVSAQDKAAAAAGKQPSPTAPARTSIEGMRVPIKVTVLLSRYQGDKRVSSMPYMLGVMASATAYGPSQKTTMRMGVDVPVMTTMFGGDGKTAPSSSYNYRGVGTNIDCNATFDESVPGLFQLALIVSESSLGLDNASAKRPGGVAADVPSFRSFNSQFSALLRDGQTTQYTSATDPVTGEVMKIDITLNVMK
jgi:hypothetical protein